jgi:SAM-dependent methyltransferase
MTAHEHHHDDELADGLTVAEFWEKRYAEAGPVWSGRPNAALVDAAPAVPAGDVDGVALDLACGEGGDAVWLAEQGWRVVAVDISATAIARGRAAAAERGLGDAIEWVVADLSDWEAPDGLALVSACFLQSTRELDRIGILRRAAEHLAVGGRLVSIAHAAMPPWSPHAGDAGITPTAEVEDLALDPAAWDVEVAELRDREVTGPDGAAATLTDSVVVIRRTA